MLDFQTNDISMAFLHEHALDKQRILSKDEQEILDRTKTLFQQADEVLLFLGGKAGRLGESIVGTGLLEATIQALHAQNKAGTPINIIVDEGVSELFNEQLYQQQYWPQIHVTPATEHTLKTIVQQEADSKHRLMLDFHGGHDGMPALQIDDTVMQHSRTLLARLFRVGVRSYAHRGPIRRYADFIEELFALPAGTIDGERAQPRLLLSAADNARYNILANELELDSQAILSVCFFQSVVMAKCYERWDEVMLLLCEYIAQAFPDQKMNFLIACGPDDDLPEGFKKADMEAWLQHFTGVNKNARVLIRTISSLRDLAILTKHATFVLANDTGPGHIAGSLGVPTITPYLPGNLYSKHVWSSTPWHYGVTLEHHAFTFHELETAVLWNKTDIINSIPPEDLQKAIYTCLPPELQVV